MRGHEPLLQLRERGKKPFFVSLTVGPKRSWIAEHWHEQQTFPHVLVEPTDAIDLLDLRFVLGCHVDVDGDTAHGDRVRALHSACVKAGAGRVVGAIHRERKNGEIEIIEYLDSAGVLTFVAEPA